jgi:predicted lipoprotein with Yx(FWY)xxD motif
MTPIFKTAFLAFAGLMSMSAVALAGSMVTGKNGMTLYTFDPDVGGKPTCYDTCATKWPAYVVKKGEKLGEGWTKVKRTDGKKQWAYDGKPVYFYSGDVKTGDKAGDGLGGVWHIISE